MEQAIVQFIGRLRKTGIEVSSSEIMDACRALPHVRLEERGMVKDALRSTLIKRGRDVPAFDALFDLFFNKKPGRADNEKSSEPEDSRHLAEVMAEMLDMHRPDMSLTAEMIMTGQFGPLTRVLLDRSRNLGLDRMESPLQAGFFLRRFRQEMDMERVGLEIEGFLRDMEERGLDGDLSGDLQAFAQSNLHRVDDELKRLIHKEMAQNRYMFLKKLEEEDLGNRNLARLSEEDILAMRPAVERLARRLKERLSMRLKHAEVGRLDLKSTLRHNIGYGGPLPDLYFRRKKPYRPQIVALCDVSNSVRNFSRFMLLFLYTLKEVVSRVRSFIFVGDMAEVTQLFQKKEIGEAVSEAASARGLTYVFRTDYGSALSQFRDDFLNSINTKTTVFILGDARNNYYDPCEDAVAAIAEKARKLIWLNPEPRLNWRLGDSVLELYQSYCTTVAECGNLNQLSQLIEENLMP